MPDSPSLPTIFAARLVQARELRKLSQRALGDKVGLGKATGSTRINRYERGTSSVSLASLERLAHALDVPAAYLLADTPDLASAIHWFSKIDGSRQSEVAAALQRMTKPHDGSDVSNARDFLDLVLRISSLSQEEWDTTLPRLRELVKPSASE